MERYVKSTTRRTQHASGSIFHNLRSLLLNLHRSSLFILSLVIVLAAGLRLWKLGEWSLWEDEILTTLDAQKFPDALPINPISYVFVKLSIFLFSSDEWGVRFIPCLVGIITVPALYFLVRPVYNSKVALLTAFFTALSPWHLFWSQNARAYIFTFLFSSISAFLFYLALEKDSTVLMVFSLISAVMLVMSHLLSAMLISALAGYVLILWLLPIENPPGLRIRNLTVFFAPFIVASMSLFIPGIFQYLTSGWGYNVWSRSPVYVAFTLVYELTIPVATVATVTVLHIFQKTEEPESLDIGSHQSPVTSHQSPVTNHQSPVTNHQSPVTSHQSIDRRSVFLAFYAGIPLVLFLISSTFMNVAGYYMFFTLPAYLTLSSAGIELAYKGRPESRKAGKPESRKTGQKEPVAPPPESQKAGRENRKTGKSTSDFRCREGRGGLTTVSVITRRSLLAFGLLLIITLTLLSQDYLYFRVENGGRPKWREALTTVKQMMSPDDLIVIPIPKITEYYLPSAESVKLKKVVKDKDKFREQLKLEKRDAWFVIDCPTISTINQGQQFSTWLNTKARFIKRYGSYARVMDRSIIIYRLEK